MILIKMVITERLGIVNLGVPLFALRREDDTEKYLSRTL